MLLTRAGHTSLWWLFRLPVESWRDGRHPPGSGVWCFILSRGSSRPAIGASDFSKRQFQVRTRSPAKGRKQALFLVEIPGVEEGVAAFSGASLHVSGGGEEMIRLNFPVIGRGGELNRFRRQ